MKDGMIAGMMCGLLSLAACSQKAEPQSCTPRSDVVTMKSLKTQNAEKDAKRDFRNGDHRLIGVHSGIGLGVPGFDGDPWASGYEVRAIQGDDGPCTQEERNLNRSTFRYAQKYNEEKVFLSQHEPR